MSEFLETAARPNGPRRFCFTGNRRPREKKRLAPTKRTRRTHLHGTGGGEHRRFMGYPSGGDKSFRELGLHNEDPVLVRNRRRLHKIDQNSYADWRQTDLGRDFVRKYAVLQIDSAVTSISHLRGQYRSSCSPARCIVVSLEEPHLPSTRHPQITKCGFELLRGYVVHATSLFSMD